MKQPPLTRWLLRALILLAVFTTAADFFLKKHAKLAAVDMPGFHLLAAVIGAIVAFAGARLLARWLWRTPDREDSHDA